MITTFYRSTKDEELLTTEEPVLGVWVHAEDANDGERALIAERYGFDSSLLKDASDPFEVPRFEIEDGISYFFTRYPQTQDGEVTTVPVLIAVAESAVVTVTLGHATMFEPFTSGKTLVFTTQKTRLFLQFSHALMLAYTRHLTELAREVQRCRAEFRTIRNRDMVRFVTIENTLNEVLGALVPTGEALRTILSGKYLATHEGDRDEIEDLLLANGQLVESAKGTLKTIQNIRNSYSVILTNNLNQTIKFLTSLTIIMTIPTIVSSLYGMNIGLPFERHPLAFWGILLVILLAMLCFAWVFSKKEWL